ncbi:hypothetical protein GCM10010172_67720 [Paractinoplanes ferrugineus]|uniref:Uncharacterized protein n=1 Tax=Paractinoplanes ferrugineus TaxID=113564 RepID=A0A919MMA9_9ACTN|nr:hypothetical protein [Actinoplanes ferrugineus]GIE13067.1 hypothetical protein Afe05nite_49070 [Actinoplanes ferrugineus]
MAALGLDSLLHFGTSIGLSDSRGRHVVPDLLLYTIQASGSEMNDLAPRIGLRPGKTLKAPISTDLLHVTIKGESGSRGLDVVTLELEGDGCTVELTNIDKVSEFAKNAEGSGFVRIILGIPPSAGAIQTLEDFVNYLNHDEELCAKGKSVASPRVDI